jgi:hypothetical protein
MLRASSALCTNARLLSSCSVDLTTSWPPSLQEFAALSARARRAARQAGLKRTNVTAAVQRVRRKK